MNFPMKRKMFTNVLFFFKFVHLFHLFYIDK